MVYLTVLKLVRIRTVQAIRRMLMQWFAPVHEISLFENEIDYVLTNDCDVNSFDALHIDTQ